MSGFCHIENDEKTKHYVKLTIEALKDKKSLLTIDNIIQAHEMDRHCSCSQDWDKNKLVCDWVSSNAKPFRIYLNTIKLISLFIIVEDIDIHSLDSKEFENIREKINKQETLLDCIFI